MAKPKKRPTPKRKAPKKPAKPPKAAPANTDHLDTSALDASSPLENHRYERFCQNIACHGMTNGQAYILAGFAVTDPNVASAGATRLLKEVKISGRVTFLKNRTAALAIDASALTKADIINMTIEQHQRNIGVRPATVTTKVKTGKDKGKLIMEERVVYNEHAANQTLKMLHDEWGLGVGGSASRGEADGGIDARATAQSPEIVEDLARLGSVRAMVLRQAGLQDNAPAPAKKAVAPAEIEQLRKLAGGK